MFIFAHCNLFIRFFNNRHDCVVNKNEEANNSPAYFMSYREDHCISMDLGDNGITNFIHNLPEITKYQDTQCTKNTDSQRTQEVYMDSCRVYLGNNEFPISGSRNVGSLTNLDSSTIALQEDIIPFNNYYTSEYAPSERDQDIVQHLYSYDDALPPISTDDEFDDNWTPTIPANDDMVNTAPNYEPHQVWYKWERSFLNIPTAAPSLTPGLALSFSHLYFDIADRLADRPTYFCTNLCWGVGVLCGAKVNRN